MDRLPFGTASTNPAYLETQANAFAALYTGKPNPYGETCYAMPLREAIAFREAISHLHAKVDVQRTLPGHPYRRGTR
jgi:hypothetical protein